MFNIWINIWPLEDSFRFPNDYVYQWLTILSVVFRHLCMKIHFMCRSLSIDQICDARLHADNKWPSISITLLHTYSSVLSKQSLTLLQLHWIYNNMARNIFEPINQSLSIFLIKCSDELWSFLTLLFKLFLKPIKAYRKLLFFSLLFFYT